QPLVTGCLYHKEHAVPYDLPANKTRSVFKTLSSPGGGGYNELSIEDRTGQEQIYIHAQRDWDENIEHDQKIRVGHERHDTVEANSYSEFKAEEHRTTHGDRKSEIQTSDHLAVGQTQHIKIGTGLLIETGDEIHYYAGEKVVIDAGMELTASAGGSFLKVDPSGVTFSGVNINLNSGGAPGQGASASIKPTVLPRSAEIALAGLLLKAPIANARALEPLPAIVRRVWGEEKQETSREASQDDLEQIITLRIGIFFDGTGNNLANAAITEQCRREDREQFDDAALASIVDHCARYGFKDIGEDGVFSTTPNNSYGNTASNIALLFDLYKDDASSEISLDATMGYVKAYIDGIGTRSGSIDSIYGQGTGSGETGVVRRVEQSPNKIADKLRGFFQSNPMVKVSDVEFDVFGFSRGAAAARHFANEVLKNDGGVLGNILRSGEGGLLPEFNWQTHASLNFIGLFDTVAAIADVRSGDFSPANHHNRGVNLYLPSGCARKVVHLTARDERRWNFALNSVGPEHKDIELPGAHSDIGGGYLSRQTEKLLLSRPELVLVTRQRPLEHSPAWKRALALVEKLEAQGLPGDGRLQPTFWKSPQPPRGGSIPVSERVFVAVAIQRTVYGDLSKVALRAMMELAMQHGVPLKKIPGAYPFAVPSDLQPIAEKIFANALSGSKKLSVADNRLLFGKYIHLSANWTPVSGLLVNKPAPNRRLVYSNKPQERYPE
ncbi:T6SS phospholipase effector Tle1-like catalytic domain-containing protein, partial [Pseudomonas matsuisoli]|uniref:T6SS phospholipase effector Tle1-like catalytic domain-containing protein n=1 Tax=Pseudomonas matsuisoli TaxID=1515666 RepID=UPI001663ED31